MFYFRLPYRQMKGLLRTYNSCNSCNSMAAPPNNIRTVSTLRTYNSCNSRNSKGIFPI